MALRRKPPSHENHERWLVSYADFITLLFATFTALFAISNVEKEKLMAMRYSLQAAFKSDISKPEDMAAVEMTGSGEGGNLLISIKPRIASTKPEETAGGDAQEGSQEDSLFKGMMLFEGKSDEKSKGKDPEKEDELEPEPTPTPEGAPPVVAVAEGNADQTLVKELRELFESIGLEGEVDIRQETRGTVISLGEAAFFALGEADVMPQSIHKLDKIVNVLRTRNFHIRIEGHTDTTPVTSGRYRSNFELSALRAANIVQFMIDNYGFDPALLSSAGYGEYRPVAPNDTAEARQQNRRVDIVILNEESARYEP